MKNLTTLRKCFSIAVYSLAVQLLQAQLSNSSAANKQAELIELSPFTVVSDRDEGYGVSSSSTATRTNEKLLDIPQSVTVITDKLWEDTGATSYYAAINYAGNVFTRNRSGGDVQFISRVFNFSFGDGFAIDGDRLYGFRRDLAAYEQVEVVKSPPSSVQGRGSNAGLVNFSYKKPYYKKAFTDGKVTVGGYDFDGGFYRGEIDVNRSLNASGTMAGRVNGVVENSDGFLDFQSGISETYGLFPSLSWKLGERTELMANAELLRSNSPYREPGQGFTYHPGGLRRLVSGLDSDSDALTALNLPRNFNAGSKVPGLEEETGAFFLSLISELTDKRSVRQVFSYFGYRNHVEWWDAAGNLPRVGTDGTLTNPYSWGRDKTDRNGITLQGDAIYRYGPESVELTNMVGYAYSDSSGKLDRYQRTRVDARFDFKNSSLPREITNVRPAAKSFDAQGINWGIYVQQDMKLFKDRLALIGGFRRDFGDNTNRKPVTAVVTQNRSIENSLRYEATLKVAPTLALYGVFSEQNDPTFTGPRFTTAPPVDPCLSQTITATSSTKLTEVGLKGEFLQGKITATLAYFEIVRTGSISAFSFTEEIPPGSGKTQISTEQVLTSGDTTNGWELKAFGLLTNRLSIIGSFAINGSSQPTSSRDSILREIPMVPEWTGHVFLKQSLLDDKGTGLEIKGGMRLIGPFITLATGASGAGRVDIDPQYSIDLGATLQVERAPTDRFASEHRYQPIVFPGPGGTAAQLAPEVQVLVLNRTIHLG